MLLNKVKLALVCLGLSYGALAAPVNEEGDELMLVRA